MLALVNLECRRLLRERLAAPTLVLMLLACVLAFVGGRALLAAQVDGRAEAAAGAGKRVAGFQEALRDRADPADAMGRLGRLGLPAVAPLAPLADFTAGTAPYGDYAVAVAATSRDAALFRRSELADPELLARGSFDLGFLAIWVAPLSLIALGYGLFAADRDSGAARLILAQAGSPLRLLLVRSGLRLVLVLLPVGATVLLLLAFGPALPGRADAALHWCLAALLLQLLWWSVILLVNSLAVGAETAALALVGLWSLATLVVPAGIAAGSQLAFPAPSPFARIVASRHAEATATAGYENAHVGDNGEDFASAMKELRENAAVDRRVERVLAPVTADHDRRVRERARVVGLLHYLSPSLVAADALATAAGTDAAAEAAYKRQAAAYRARLTATVNRLIARGRPLGPHADRALPVFRPAPTRPNDTPAIVWLAMATLLLGGWACARLRRAAP